MLLDDRVHELLSQWEQGGGSRTPEQLCADCPELIDEVRRRIGQLSSADRLLGTDGADDRHDEPRRTPPQISGYDVADADADFIGEGGMGTVWRARQRSTNRTVALKVMSAAGLCSARARARFHREIELASRLEHPNVARVYDGDVQRGTCYCAMELIEGSRLDRYAHRLESSQLPPAALAVRLLQLMERVCRAVHYAHQRGVIHRDLKPQNILVDAADEPHVLDFGLAKEIGGGAADSLSMEGAVPGTLRYMSPEQAAGRSRDVDTRSDVYSLGVILYELLLQQPAHDLSGDTMAVRRRVAEDEVRPPRTFDKQLAPDLEAILLRALEREPPKRYGSAAEFADDIARFLSCQPVKAQKRTAAYVARKWLRRHRYRAAVGAAVAVVLCGGAVWSYVSIAHQRDRAATQAAIADAVNDFLEKMLTGPDPAVAQGRDPTLRELLDSASVEVSTGFSGQPLVEAGVRRMLGRTYINLYDYKRAEEHIRAAYERCRAILGDDDPMTLRAATLLGFYLEASYQLDRASQMFEDTLARQSRALPAEHPDTLETVHRLANVRCVQKRWADAEVLMRRAWEGRRRVLGEGDPDTIWSLSDLGVIVSALGRAEDGEAMLREALRLRLAKQGDQHFDTLNAEFNLASNLLKQRKFDEAEALLKANAEMRMIVLREAHPARTLPLQSLAELCKMQGRTAEAADLLRESFDVCNRASPGHIETLRTRIALMETLMLLDRHSEVEQHLQQLAQLAEEKLVAPAFDPLWLTTYASAIATFDRRPEAQAFLRRALEHGQSLPTSDKGAVQAIERTLAGLQNEHVSQP